MTNETMITHCRDVIANPQDHLDWVVEMAKTALASYEAKKVGFLFASIGGVAYSISDSPIEGMKLAGAVYDAPPVLVTKSIDLSSCRKLWYDHDDLSAEVECIPVKDLKKAIRAAGYEVKS